MRILENDVNWSKTFDKSDILDHLKKNKEEYTVLLEDARKGFKKEALAKLRRRLTNLETSDVPIEIYLSLSPPKDYTEDYNSLIQMLEMTTDEEVTLNPKQFKMIVMDKWDWTEDFLNKNRSYSSLVGAKNG